MAAALVGARRTSRSSPGRARAGRPQPRLLRVYPRFALAVYAINFALGAWMYPRYRVEVRAHWLDAHARWAAVLFDIKENLAALLFPALLSLWWISRRGGADRSPSATFAACAYALAAGVWFNALSGLLTVSVRSP
ncbi:MAG: hypothetical protein R3A52_19710 [Polyangiales bacterium]